MKKFFISFLVICLVVSLSVPFLVSADSNSATYDSANLTFYVGTTGGGRVLAHGDLTLLTAMLYMASDGFPSFMTIYQEADNVLTYCGDYTRWWLRSNAVNVTSLRATEVPPSIVTLINSALHSAGSSLRIPSYTVGLNRIDDYEALNTCKSSFSIANLGFFLNEANFLTLDPNSGSVFKELQSFNTYYKEVVAFNERYQDAVLGDIQESLDVMYRTESAIRNALTNPIDVIPPEKQGLIENVIDAEEDMINNLKANTFRGRDFMATSNSLLSTYLQDFALVGAVFALFYEISWIKTIVFISFALGFFAFCINVTSDVTGSLVSSARNGINKAQKSAQAKKASKSYSKKGGK